MADTENVTSTSNLLSSSVDTASIAAPEQQGFFANLADFTTASGVVAIQSLGTIPDSLRNLFRSEENQLEAPDYEETVRKYAGEDALEFYKRNTELVDTSAFVGSSLLPGLGGIKVLNSAQAVYKAKAVAAGAIPEELGFMAGLAANNTAELAAVARANAMLGKEGGRLAAAGGMIGQQVLEAAAFEVAVAAMLEQSPLLNEMNFSDTLENGLIGVAIGGAVGSIFGGFGLAKQIKEGFREGAQLENVFKPQFSITSDAGAQAAESMIKYSQLKYGINEDTGLAYSDLAGMAANSGLAKTDDQIAALTGKLKTSYDRALDQYRNTMVDKLHEAGHDKALIVKLNAMLDAGKALDTDTVIHALSLSKGSTRVGAPEATKAGGMAAAVGNTAFKYFDMVNGGTHLDAPNVYSLGNIGDVSIQGNKVTAGKRSWTVDTNPQYNYDIALRTTDEIAARDAVLYEKVKTVNDAKRLVGANSVYEMDRPMLSAMARVWAKEADDAMSLSIRQSDGKVLEFGSYKGYKDWFDGHIQGKLSDRVSGNTLKDMLGSTADEVASNLQRITGVAIKQGSSKDANAWYSPADKSITMDIAGIMQRNPKTWQTEVFRIADHELGHAIDDTVTNLNLIKAIKGTATEAQLEQLYKEAIKLSRKARPGHWLQALKDPKMKSYLFEDPELIADARQQLARMTDDQRAKYPALMSFMGTSLFSRTKEYNQMLNAAKPISGAEVLAKLDYDFAETALSGVVTSRAESLAAKVGIPDSNPYTVPTHLKLQYDTTKLNTFAKELGVEAGDMHMVEASAILEVAASKSRELRTAASMNVLGDLDPMLKEADDVLPSELSLAKQLEAAIPETSGQVGRLTASSPAYASLAESMKYLGSQVNRLLGLASNKVATEFSGVAQIMRANPEVARGWASVNNWLLSTPEKYALSEQGDGLVHIGIRDAKTKLAEAQAAWKAAEQGSKQEGALAREMTKLTKQLEEYQAAGITEARSFKDFTKNPELLATVVQAHVRSNADKLAKRSQLHQASSGNLDHLAEYSEVVHPIQYQYKYQAHAYLAGKHLKNPDGSIDDLGEGGMIYANTPADLIKQQAELESKYPGVYKFRTMSDIKEHKEAWREYKYASAVTESTFDSTMKREGKTASLVVPTDPEVIIENLVGFHERFERGLVRRALQTQYQNVYTGMDKLGATYRAYETAQRSGAFSLKHLRDSVDPWTKLVNESLDISSRGEMAWFHKINQGIDDVVSATYNSIWGSRANKPVSAEELAEIGQQVQRAGFVMPTAAMLQIANRTVESGVATRVANKLNGALSFFALRTDFYNAFNNFVAHPIMYNGAVRALIEDTAKASPEFAKLVKSEFGGNGFMNGAKLYMKAFKEVTGGDDLAKQYRGLYRDLGFDVHLANQYADIQESAAKALATGKELEIDRSLTSLSNLALTAERATGNKLAESQTRLISARTAHIIAEHAVKAGALDPSNVYAFINNFVSKVHGTYLASQRPHLFQGALGQSMGLFLTYMFNMMQQFTKYMVDGNKGSAQMMAAMQGSIYGLNGMPAFSAFNTNIIGSAAGNTDNMDIYQAVYQGFGADAADWIMYGMGSNIAGLIHPDLKSNMYTRGDLNPRQMTIIPTSYEEIPVYGALTKFTTNLVRTASNATAAATGDAQGAFAGSLLLGLEHNGINRPLAGLGRVLQGFTNDAGISYSTDNKYHVNAAWDMYSMASVTQMLGAKPLVEARMMDAYYRSKTYQAEENAEVAAMKQKMTLQMRYGTFDGELFDSLQVKYLELGHTVDQWNKLVQRVAKDANASNINKLLDANTRLASQQLIKFMPGYDAGEEGIRFRDTSQISSDLE